MPQSSGESSTTAAAPPNTPTQEQLFRREIKFRFYSLASTHVFDPDGEERFDIPEKTKTECLTLMPGCFTGVWVSVWRRQIPLWTDFNLLKISTRLISGPFQSNRTLFQHLQVVPQATGGHVAWAVTFINCVWQESGHFSPQHSTRLREILICATRANVTKNLV